MFSYTLYIINVKGSIVARTPLYDEPMEAYNLLLPRSMRRTLEEEGREEGRNLANHIRYLLSQHLKRSERKEPQA